MMMCSSVEIDPNYPFVTIAIPTFNRATLLKGCIASALSQTYPRLELLVSNNASSDDTRLVLSQFSDPRLRVIHQETNIGLLPNWNACVTNAKGDYIVIVSDDDRISPWLLEQCVRLIRQQPQLPVVITLSNIHLASHGRTKPARRSRLHDTGIWDGTEILTEFLTDQVTVTMCSVMMRTNLLRVHGGIPLHLRHTADIGAWAPLLLLGRAGFVNDACATFKHHNNSETAQLGVEQLLRDGRKVAELISYIADNRITDPRQRRTIQTRAHGCFARRGLVALADFRNSGGGFSDFMNVLWRFRHDFYRANLVSILRLIAVVLCPRPLANHFRELRRDIPERLA
jgi:glycosyltransferase involved in cell wall biosynthesis